MTKHKPWHGGLGVNDHPRPDMEAIVAALLPDAVEIGIYREYAAHCLGCGDVGHYHDPGYLAGFLTRHAKCEAE